MKKAKGKRSRPTKPPATGATSIRLLGDAVGRTSSTIVNWLRLPEWPIPRLGPWSEEHINALRAWMTTRATRAPSSASEHVERTRLIQARRAKIEHELAVARGEYVSREDVEAGRAQRVHAVKRGLMGLAEDLAGELPGKSADEVRAIVESRVMDLLRAFSRGQGDEAT